MVIVTKLFSLCHEASCDSELELPFSINPHILSTEQREKLEMQGWQLRSATVSAGSEYKGVVTAELRIYCPACK